MLRLFEGGGDKRPHGRKAVLKRRDLEKETKSSFRRNT